MARVDNDAEFRGNAARLIDRVKRVLVPVHLIRELKIRIGCPRLAAWSITLA